MNPSFSLGVVYGTDYFTIIVKYVGWCIILLYMNCINASNPLLLLHCGYNKINDNLEIGCLSTLTGFNSKVPSGRFFKLD